MAERDRRVTGAEVAERSGVSRATVSYVLNGTPNQSISPQTRQRVLDVAAQLGYTPFAPARALRAGRSDVVLLLLPEWPIGPTIARLVERLTLTLAAARLTLVVHVHPGSARPVSELWMAITPAAVINHQALDNTEVAAARRAGIPVVTPAFQLGGATNGDGTGDGTGEGGTFADFQRQIGRVQAEHLAVHGHRRLGFALPHDDRLSAFAGPRFDGVRQTCARLGLDEPTTQTVALDSTSAGQAIGHWRRRRVTALCAYNDEVALALLAGMRTRRLNAPTDLAVVGVDNLPSGALAQPSLTTVATGMPALGEYLAAAVINTLDGRPAPPGPGHDIIELIHRDSS